MQRKFDPKVFQLGYVALESAGSSNGRRITTRDSRHDRDGQEGDVGFGSIYRFGHNHHDLVLRPAKQKSLLHLGFHLKPHIALADFAREVREYGLAATIKTDSQPGSRQLVEVEGPGGNVFQFYSTVEAPTPGFRGDRRVAASPRPCRGDLHRGREAHEVLPGIPRLLVHRRHRGHRELLHLQPGPPCGQHRQRSGVAGSPHRLRTPGHRAPHRRGRHAAEGRLQPALGAVAAHGRASSSTPRWTSSSRSSGSRSRAPGTSTSR